MHESEYINEVDSSDFFQRKDRSFKDAKSTEEILSHFGYTIDDKIRDRDIVLIYKKVETDLEKEIYDCAHSGRYDDAKELKLRLTRFKKDFESLQTSRLKSTQLAEQKLLSTVSYKINSQTQHNQSQQQSQLQDHCQQMKDQLIKFHEIELANFEKEISRQVMPPIKYSRRYLELMKAEKELIRLNHFEDASKVRRMINQIKPKEEQSFYLQFDATINARRQTLLEKQTQATDRLVERLTALEWKDIRGQQQQANISNQRMKIHESNLSHTHLLESKVRPEMSVKPSALWTKRQGYENTSSSLRGRQLMKSMSSSSSAGSGDVSSINLESLVRTHDFSSPLSGTMDYYRK